jgi:hypothetical protein
MTLDQFLAITAAVPETALRSAMTTALAVEPARTPAAYRRFYTRVVHELGLNAETEEGAEGTRSQGVCLAVS